MERGSLCVLFPSETLKMKRELQIFWLGDLLFCVLPYYCYYWYMWFLTVTFFFFAYQHYRIPVEQLELFPPQNFAIPLLYYHLYQTKNV